MNLRRIIPALAAALALLLGIVIATDPIYRLGCRLLWYSLRLSGMPWESGMTNVGGASSAEEAKERFLTECVKSYDSILEVRKVPVLSMEHGPEICIGILVRRGTRKEIVLIFRSHDGWHTHWYLQ